MKKMMEATNTNMKKMMEVTNKNIESLKEDLHRKLDDNSKALKEDNQKNMELLNKKMDDVSQKMEENNEKINTKIDREITVVRREIVEGHERCEQYNQELQQTRNEVDGRINSIEEINEVRIESLKKMSQDEIKRVRTDVGEICEEIDASVNTIRTLTVTNKEKIEELCQREILQIREELETIRNRPAQGHYLQPIDNRDIINFKNYKKNPIEFLEQVEENLTRIRESRWTVIRSLIDEYFKEIHDNWWTATRHLVGRSKVTKSSRHCSGPNTGQSLLKTSYVMISVMANMTPVEELLQLPTSLVRYVWHETSNPGYQRSV